MYPYAQSCLCRSWPVGPVMRRAPYETQQKQMAAVGWYVWTTQERDTGPGFAFVTASCPHGTNKTWYWQFTFQILLKQQQNLSNLSQTKCLQLRMARAGRDAETRVTICRILYTCIKLNVRMSKKLHPCLIKNCTIVAKYILHLIQQVIQKIKWNRGTDVGRVEDERLE